MIIKSTQTGRETIFFGRHNREADNEIKCTKGLEWRDKRLHGEHDPNRVNESFFFFFNKTLGQIHL